MKKVLYMMLMVVLAMVLTNCSNNYANGERVGLVTQFSKAGLFYDSWEGQLNMTQTGMNSSTEFDFSLDNDKPELQNRLIPILDSAAHYGWKVSLHYTEVFGKNWFCNRGETNHFIDTVIVLDKNPMKNVFNSNTANVNSTPSNNIIHDTIFTGIRDTIYVVIQK